jgi:hypothetical protein
MSRTDGIPLARKSDFARSQASFGYKSSGQAYSVAKQVTRTELRAVTALVASRFSDAMHGSIR